MTEREQELTDLSLEEVEEQQRPFGKNDLGSFAMFTQRKKYKEEVYPTQTVPTPLDLWYDNKRSYYGKVDTNGYSIILREKHLKQINSSQSQNTWAMDFVVDAFNDFRDHYVFLNKINSEDNEFKFLNPKKVWGSSANSYNGFLDTVFDDFSNSFMAFENRDSELLDFNSFLKLFAKYMRFSKGKFPITYSTFIQTPFTSPLSSGLIIELSDDSHGDDVKKFDKFISNVNFECYAETAQQFGFKLDKNYPARMIADVKSPKMLEYMSKYPKPPKPFDLKTPDAPTIPDAPVPPSRETTPWRVGDIVEIYVVVPTDRKDKFFILTDYTMPKNQAFPAGNRSLLVRDESGKETTEIDVLRKYFEGYGKLVKYGFKINNPVPQSGIRRTRQPVRGDDGQFLIGDLVNYGQELSLATVPLPSSAAFEVMSANKIFEEEYKTNAQAAMNRRNLRNSGINSTSINSTLTPREINGQPLDYASGQFKVEEVSTGTASRRFIAELPRSSVHVKPSPNSAALSQRITDFYNQPRRQLQYQKQYKAWEQIKNNLNNQYEVELANYKRLKDRHEQTITDFNTLPRLSFDNFIQSRYNLAYRADLEMMKEMLMQFYYSYSSAKPQAFIKRGINCGNSGAKTHTNIIDREQITRSIILEGYKNDFWLQYYIALKSREKMDKIPDNTLTQIQLQANELLRKKSLDEAMKYVTDQFKNFS